MGLRGRANRSRDGGMEGGGWTGHSDKAKKPMELYNVQFVRARIIICPLRSGDFIRHVSTISTPQFTSPTRNSKSRQVVRVLSFFSGRARAVNDRPLNVARNGFYQIRP